MSNGFQDGAQGGISFSTPIFSFGNSVPAVNSGYSFDMPMSAIQAFSNNALTFTQNNANNNRGFLDGVISRSQSQVTSTAQGAFGYQQSALDAMTNISGQMGGAVRDAGKNRSRCYITTAAIREEGLPDDCEMLTTLRKFRDDFMLKRPDLKLFVDEYYRIAPDIAERISAREDSAEVYRQLKVAYLVPAVAAIKRGENMTAFHLYREMTRTAAKFAAEEAVC